MIRAYGTEAAGRSGQRARQPTIWAAIFGATLTEAELRWLRAHEYARTAEDVVWRRSKLGLRLTAEQIAAIAAFMEAEEMRAAAE